MKVLDLFSGIGGFSLGLEAAGMTTAAFCEYDPNARLVLKKHWPHVPIFNDIHDLNAEVLRDNGVKDVGLVCGGYPCQPFSLAGPRLGAEDDRHLWPQMLRLIKELRPTWVIGENVSGHVTMGLDEVLTDLESESYTSRAFIVPACAVDAPHRRDRTWVVAHTELSGLRSEQGAKGGSQEKTKWASHSDETDRSGEDVADPNSLSRKKTICERGIEGSPTSKSGGRFGESWRTWRAEPNVGRVADGVPRRSHRLKQLGNAVVPQIVEQFGRMIMEIERSRYE